MSYFQDVQRYRRKLRLEPANADPGLVNKATFHARMDFLHEELTELLLAQDAGDLLKVADAIADATCILLGLADLMGLPFDAVWAEVIRSNMDKERGPSDGRSYSEGVVKPEGWRAPDIRGAIKRGMFT